MMTTLKQLQRKAFTGAVAVAFAGLAAAASAQERGTINVFNDINYGGESHTFSSDMPNLADQGWNDRISSIQVAPGEAWQVCADAGFRNRCVTITSNVADLREMGLNDQISSIRRVGGRGYGYRNRGDVYGTTGTSGVSSTVARVFTGANFRGQSAVLNGVTADLRQYNLNDRLRSIEIPTGETWEVCRDINFEGGCHRLSGNVSDLQSMGLGDISSMRPVSGNRNYPYGGYNNNGGYNNGGYNNGGYNNNQQGLVIFDRSGFQGGSQFVPMGGAANPGFSARRGSLQVRGGTWEVCDDQGQCRTVSSDVSDMSQLGLSGRITSVRSVNGGLRRFFRR
jgi:hypothetical protein